MPRPSHALVSATELLTSGVLLIAWIAFTAFLFDGTLPRYLLPAVMAGATAARLLSQFQYQQRFRQAMQDHDDDAEEPAGER